MKLSKKSTEYILVKTHCANEYADVACCLIHIPEEVIEVWKERLVRVKGLALDTEHLCRVEWLYSDVYWLTMSIDEITDDEDSDYCYVKLDKDDKVFINNEMSEKITCCSMHMSPSGTVYIEGWGKYSGDQYTTDEIDIDKL